MHPIIRTATPEDAPAVGALIAEFQDYLSGLGDQTAYDFGAERYLRDGFGADPAFWSIVAETEGEIVGYALYTFGYDTDFGCRLVHLVDLFVTARRRRAGVGEMLFRQVGELGRARGAGAMIWEVYKPNALAMRFYEKLGAEYIEASRYMAIAV